jgi:hypothetical protein
MRHERPAHAGRIGGSHSGERATMDSSTRELEMATSDEHGIATRSRRKAKAVERLIDLEMRTVYASREEAAKARGWTLRQVTVATRIGLLLPVVSPVDLLQRHLRSIKAPAPFVLPRAG